MQEFIRVRGAKEHNLKSVDIDIPKNKLVVITGLSGSGKSSLAFDTIYAEGQRRYVESLSAYARQFLQLQNKPDVESISGLSPAIAIDQKTTSRNPRSTVGTITEIYDYMRLLFARIGVPYSPATGLPIQSQSASQITREIEGLPQGTKLYILSPLVRGAKGEYRKEIALIKKQGYHRIKLNGEIYDLDTFPPIDKNKKNNIEVIVDRVSISSDMGNRLADSIENALKIGDGLVYIEIVSQEEGKENQILTFSEKFACPVSGFQLSEIEPRIFSFNSPFGACKHCDGLGTELFFDPNLIVPNPKLSLKEGALAPWANGQTKFQMQTLEAVANHFKFSIHHAFEELPKNIQNILLQGHSDLINITYSDGMRKQTVSKQFEGIIPILEKKLADMDSWGKEELRKYQNERRCSECNGYRLKSESLCVKVGGSNIGEVCGLTIGKAIAWFEELPNHLTKSQQEISERVIKEIKERLSFLNNVGLEYLTLSRESGTLSGGESQRIRLASQIGSGLSGVLYVLDEPSIGLHQSDNSKLIATLKNLRDLGNTVIVVEHDEEMTREADYVIDMGPAAGVHGGLIIAKGTPKEIEKDKNSITGMYLSGEKYIPIPKKRRPYTEGKEISLEGVRTNNLRNVSVTFPLGNFVCVSGVSGGGKSSLIIHTLYKAAIKKLENANVQPGVYDKLSGLEYIDKLIDIDQSPIGRTPRSNPATYTGAFSHIRDWFVDLPESKARGYKAGRFSFNVKGGRCETCQGDGVIKIEMHFLPDVYVKCDECKGKRYNRETLEIKYKEKSISDVLDMTIEDALVFFEKIPSIRDKLNALMEVGLGYVKLGQSATTLSGGEAQRVKLAKELARKSTGRTLYILDEPTTGLHSEDINKLLRVLHKLVDLGNSVLVIEHNLDVVKTADYIIDIGPGGGDKGGQLVFAGTPENLAKCKKSLTAKYLDEYLKKGKKENL